MKWHYIGCSAEGRFNNIGTFHIFETCNQSHDRREYAEEDIFVHLPEWDHIV